MEPRPIFKEPHTFDSSYMVVGRPPIILKNEYPAAQMWFPFMAGTIFVVEKTEPAQRPERIKSAKAVTERVKRPLIIPDQMAIRLFHNEKNMPQLFLPFREHRKLSNKRLKHFADAGFPSFCRNSEGHVLFVDFRPRSKKEQIIEWCEENCKGIYHVSMSRALFENDEDFVLAKMMFG